MDTYTKNHLMLHTFCENDMDGLISLSQSVGWDYDANDMKTILSSGKIVGHKSEIGQTVSSAAIIPYDLKDSQCMKSWDLRLSVMYINSFA
ncbi:hypothetical protein [Bacillus sp. SJS]|uniref:hypothetical protein n=1 Tax=Bacillus sp. SJS TaxID=1423321 RepID=UPI00068F5950|nr:hypothetical protein [Bacillus sp. SJS]